MSENRCPDSTLNRIQAHSARELALYGLTGERLAALRRRLEAKIARTDGCWLWTGLKNQYGYGQLSCRLDGTFYNFYVHRLSWWLAHGPIPPGLKVCHNCPTGDNPACVRPEHLFLGTQPQNLADARQKGRLDESRARVRTMTPAQRLEVFHAPRFRGSEVALAARFGVTKARISAIRRGIFVGCPTGDQQRPNQTFEAVFESVPFVHLPVAGEVW